MTFTADALKKAHGPAARRKAEQTRRRNLLAKADRSAHRGNGATTLIDVAGLPPRPKKKVGGKMLRRKFTPEMRTQVVARINALIATGKTIRDACQEVELSETQFRHWKLGLKKNGSPFLKGNGGAIRLTVMIGADSHDITLQEAINIHSGLDALLRSRVS